MFFLQIMKNFWIILVYSMLIRMLSIAEGKCKDLIDSGIMIVAEERFTKSLSKRIFGYSSFRGNQEAVIRNILNGHNTFCNYAHRRGQIVVLPVACHDQRWPAIVISPLIALMKNQVDQLNAYGIAARFMNSTLSKGEITRLKKDCVSGTVKLLYVAPESLNKEENIAFLQKVNVSFVAIDEAHCISEWGHDFRPEYRKIKTMIAQLGDMPVIALTATATPRCNSIFRRTCRWKKLMTFLFFQPAEPLLRSKAQKKLRSSSSASLKTIKASRHYLLPQPQEGGRNRPAPPGQWLQGCPYHAGLDPDVRVKNQDDFLNEETDIIVATIAFGWE